MKYVRQHASEFGVSPDRVGIIGFSAGGGYANGVHGFGMRKQGLPTDDWIDRFAEWMEMQGRMKK